MIQILPQKHWTIVDPELSALHKQWRHPTNLKNVPEESFSHFCNQSSLLEGRLSHIFMSFVFPSAEADTFSSAFDFWEILGFSLFDASEVILKFWVPTRSWGGIIVQVEILTYWGFHVVTGEASPHRTTVKTAST